MGAFIVVASALAIGAAAWPTTTAPTSTVTWETKTWSSYTWTQPASPAWGDQGGWPGWGNPSPPQSSCISEAQASVVANNFRDTIAEPFSTPAVEATFASNFQDYSDSVIELIDSGCPSGPIALGSPTFSSLADFIAGQSGQAPIPFDILNLWYGCTSVHFRWRSSPGPGTVQPEEEVTGIIAIEAVKNTNTSSSEPWLIETVYSEFNSGAWLYDLGVFVPNCTASTKR